MFIPFTLFAGFSLLYHKNTFEKMQFFLEADFPIRFFAIPFFLQTQIAQPAESLVCNSAGWVLFL